MRTILIPLILFIFGVSAYAGEAPAAAPPPIKDEDLQRIDRKLPAEFPWIAHPPAVPKKAGSEAASSSTSSNGSGVPDVTGSNIIVKALGDFSSSQKDNKETLILNKDVEIEQPLQKSLLRGQKVRIVRNLATGDTEILEAKGSVEMVTPDRKARGESLLYEIQFGPNHELTKNLYTLEGKGTNLRATLWQGDDVFQAERFINDQRLDTFRILGGPVAVIKVATDPNAAPAPHPAPTGGGMVPTMSLTGGKIRLEADGEMFYESAIGKVHMTRNVMIQQEATADQGGFRINCDEALMTMGLPAPGQQAPEGGGVFTGDLKMLDCNGRVEVYTTTQTILCDKARFDMEKHLFIMEMKDAKDSVRVYMKETPTEGKILVSPKRLTVNMATNEFESAVSSHMEAFTGAPPSIRRPNPNPVSAPANGKTVPGAPSPAQK